MTTNDLLNCCCWNTHLVSYVTDRPLPITLYDFNVLIIGDGRCRAYSRKIFEGTFCFFKLSNLPGDGAVGRSIVLVDSLLTSVAFRTFPGWKALWPIDTHLLQMKTNLRIFLMKKKNRLVYVNKNQCAFCKYMKYFKDVIWSQLHELSKHRCKIFCSRIIGV